jgi:hypothetical protein
MLYYSLLKIKELTLIGLQDFDNSFLFGYALK